MSDAAAGALGIDYLGPSPAAPEAALSEFIQVRDWL